MQYEVCSRRQYCSRAIGVPLAFPQPTIMRGESGGMTTPWFGTGGRPTSLGSSRSPYPTLTQFWASEPPLPAFSAATKAAGEVVDEDEVPAEVDLPGETVPLRARPHAYRRIPSPNVLLLGSSPSQTPWSETR